MDALRSEETAILSQIQRITSSNGDPADIAAELRRLRAARGVIRERMRALSDADSGAAGIAERNLFEDITLEEGSYNFAVSTTENLVTARRINLTGRSYNVAGQLTDESFQKAVEVFASNGLQPARDSDPDKFHTRHGRGVPLMRDTSGAGRG